MNGFSKVYLLCYGQERENDGEVEELEVGVGWHESIVVLAIEHFQGKSEW